MWVGVGGEGEVGAWSRQRSVVWQQRADGAGARCCLRSRHPRATALQGKLASLRRVKDDVKEVLAGTECGVAVEGFKDWEVRKYEGLCIVFMGSRLWVQGGRRVGGLQGLGGASLRGGGAAPLLGAPAAQALPMALTPVALTCPPPLRCPLATRCAGGRQDRGV